MLNPNPYMMLSGALGFSAADLTANRLGILTPKQREMLTNQRLSAFGWPVILMLLLAAGGYMLQTEFIFIVFCAACMVSIVLATWQRFQEDLEGRVEVVAGQWTLRPLAFGRYAVIMNGQTFNLSKQMRSAFNEGVHYRAHVIEVNHRSHHPIASGVTRG